MIIKGKYFLPPPKDAGDFNELFGQLIAAGAGRPVDKDGFSSGPWTPELLADAISNIAVNHRGVDIRTVQLWFQENAGGIRSDNIRWMARIFGCNDPKATSEWQVKLFEAHADSFQRGKRKLSSSERTCHLLQA
jgi:hypothetical protein